MYMPRLAIHAGLTPVRPTLRAIRYLAPTKEAADTTTRHAVMTGATHVLPTRED